MAALCRIDPHAHLYDTFSTEGWCRAAIRNLGASPEVTAIVIVVDREGQDSLARLRCESPSFATWEELWEGRAGRVSLKEGALTVIQGTQYVTTERVEALALGVRRAAPDGMKASEYVSMITAQGGLACLPWSPGKWLGARGVVIRKLLDTVPPTLLTVGDISVRSSLGPPSLLLWHAHSKGFSVLTGTDPLPRPQDESLVGSFGVELSWGATESLSWETLKNSLLSSARIRPWGHRNSLPLAARRMASSLRP
jgi:hypothetical protein